MSVDMQAMAATYPPLHQISTFPSSSVEFYLHLAVPQDAVDTWEAKLRYCLIGSDSWQEATLIRRSLPYTVARPDTNAYLSFSAAVHLPGTVKFTVQFRHGAGAWATAGQDGPDSIVVPREQSGLRSHEIGDYIEIMNPYLRITKLDDDKGPKTTSWLLETPVIAADGDAPHMEQVMLGKPFAGEFLRWFALSRHTASWLAPRQGTTYFKLDVASVLCSFVDKCGRHLVALGISGFENVMTIFGDNNEGALMIKIRNDRQAPGFGRVIVSVSDDFQTALSDALAHVRAYFPAETSSKALQSSELWADGWINGLLYSLGEMSESFNDLANKGIAPTTLILDDSRGRDETPGVSLGPWNASLGSEIASMKEKCRTIRKVIYRHSLFVGAKSTESTEGNYRSSSVMHAIPGGAKAESQIVIAADAHRFYDDYYRFLRSCGVDAVQLDNVHMPETVPSAAMRASMAETYLEAQYTASSAHFSASGMACRALSPNTLFRNLKLSSASPVVQNSGPFPDYKKHIFVNNCNALLIRGIGNIPSWDLMPGDRALSLAARAISGGPIQVGDEVDGALVRRVCGRSGQDKTIVLRPSGIGAAMNPYTAFEDPVSVKIGNTHAVGKSHVSVLGFFNVTEQPRLEMLHIRDFPHVASTSNTYLVRSSSGMIIDVAEPFSISLGVSEYEIFCAYPLTILNATAGEPLRAAVLGLADKILGAAAILDASITLGKTGIQIAAVLKSLGVLGKQIFYSSSEVYFSGASQRGINGYQVKLQGNSFRDGVTVESDVVRVNLEDLWVKNDVKGDTDEVRVEVTLEWA